MLPVFHGQTPPLKPWIFSLFYIGRFIITLPKSGKFVIYFGNFRSVAAYFVNLPAIIMNTKPSFNIHNYPLHIRESVCKMFCEQIYNIIGRFNHRNHQIIFRFLKTHKSFHIVGFFSNLVRSLKNRVRMRFKRILRIFWVYKNSLCIFPKRNLHFRQFRKIRRLHHTRNIFTRIFLNTFPHPRRVFKKRKMI
jgi:hypothetical protein